jgi:phosphoglycolate phosphatase-like HAD superfamily hydrolase
MPLLYAGAFSFDASLVVFDKDGTLINFEFMWGQLARAWVEAIALGPGTEALRHDLYQAWGYSPQNHRILPDSPLAMATTSQLLSVAAAVLYRHGLRWLEAEERVRQAIERTRSRPELALARLVRPAGDVVGLFNRLRIAGARIAIATTDERASTLETLDLLGVSHLVDCAVCGDDGIAGKPAPDMLLVACSQLGMQPANTAVVGDTEADLLMAQRGGAGLRLAVLGGAGDPAVLERLADAVIPSVDSIVVRAPTISDTSN